MYECDGKVHLVTDYLPGGELFDKIMRLKSFSEKEACAVIEVLARTLDTLHNQMVSQIFMDQNLLPWLICLL